jgi:hypothetical protein
MKRIARNTAMGSSALALLGAGLAADSFAADAAWEFNPTIQAGYLYDDNYRLTEPGSEIRVQGPVADAQLEMHTLTQTGEFSVTPRVRATYFPDEPDLDTVDYFGTMDWRRSGQRFQTRLRADFASQDVINSEQPDADVDTGLGEPVFGDAGRVIVSNRRVRYVVRPSASWEVNQRNRAEIEGGYANVSFDESVPGAQVGFDTQDISAGLRTRMSEVSTLATRLVAARYDLQFRDVTTAYGAELQWDTRTARDTRSFFRAGAQQVALADGGHEVAWIAGAGVSVIIGRNELFTDVSRAVGPSSAGVVVARDQLRFRLTRAMTPRLSFLAGLRGTHDDDVDSSSGFVPRSYASADVGFDWRWQEEWSLRFTYDYTWQEFDAAPDAATSSGAMATIVYQPLQRLRPRNN